MRKINHETLLHLISGNKGGKRSIENCVKEKFRSRMRIGKFKHINNHNVQEWMYHQSSGTCETEIKQETKSSSVLFTSHTT